MCGKVTSVPSHPKAEVHEHSSKAIETLAVRAGAPVGIERRDLAEACIAREEKLPAEESGLPELRPDGLPHDSIPDLEPIRAPKVDSLPGEALRRVGIRESSHLLLQLREVVELGGLVEVLDGIPMPASEQKAVAEVVRKEPMGSRGLEKLDLHVTTD